MVVRNSIFLTLNMHAWVLVLSMMPTIGATGTKYVEGISAILLRSVIIHIASKIIKYLPIITLCQYRILMLLPAPWKASRQSYYETMLSVISLSDCNLMKHYVILESFHFFPSLAYFRGAIRGRQQPTRVSCHGLLRQQDDICYVGTK